MKVTSHRRQLIVVVLLVLAVAGAALRAWAPQPSLARDVGTLLLVLWLPIVGNIIAFVIARVSQRRRRHAFAPERPFTPHLLAELNAEPGQVRLKADDRRCTLVLGNEGFTARLAGPLGTWLTGPQPHPFEIELLRPDLALARFTPGAAFEVYAAPGLVGRGRVLEMLAPAA